MTAATPSRDLLLPRKIRGKQKGKKHTARQTSDAAKLLNALRSAKPVSGATHTFYRYPARFSPDFVREAITHFTKPGDLVADPFMGGGTCGVEALAEGRRFLGNDLNQLAYFVSQVKTTLLSEHDEACVMGWSNALPQAIDLSEAVELDPFWAAYQKHVPWRVRTLFTQALATLDVLKNDTQRDFARCVLLSTAQWALDCKTKVPSKQDILEKHLRFASDMVVGQSYLRDRFVASTDKKNIKAFRVLLCSDASKIDSHKRSSTFGPPRLVLTSPPYLGVHVLYHRWQVLGRRETSAPYWLANRLDGNPGAFYTFADRRAKAPDRYLDKLRKCFGAIAKLGDTNTKFVQLVAFPDADVQLPLYLKTLREAGLSQCDVLERGATAASISRDVPNRRWYALVTNQTNSSTEFMLIHKRSKS